MSVKEALERQKVAGQNLDAAVYAEKRARWNWRRLAVGTQAREYARANLRRAKVNTRKAEWAHAEAKRAVAAARKAEKKSVWHPNAKRVPHQDSGPFVNGKPKLVWHTTEGRSLPNYGGSAPHFTLDPKTGDLWQHIPIDRAARALAHPPGTPETNRARAIQVELIGFAGTTQDWSEQEYARIASLARWIERNAGVPRRSTVNFTVPADRLSGQAFVDYSGHIGHAHVPGNDHWDPGRFRIDRVI